MKSTFLIAAAVGLAPLGMVVATPAALAQTATETAAEQPAEATAGGYSVHSALAEVDGTTLTLGELITIRRQLPEQYQAIPDEVLFRGITEQMIDQMLLAEAGRKAGLDKRPAVALNLLVQQRAILADAYLRAETEARATPAKVEALYEERYVDAEPQEEVRARHILVDSEEKAAELKKQIDGGADFAEVAKENGTDGSASRGGDLGWFVHGDMIPVFADAAFAMEPGTVSDPVKSEFGWHLIKLEERRMRQAPELAQVRGELLRELAEQAQVDIVAELREKAAIVMPEMPVPAQAIRDDALLDAAD